MIIYTEGSVEVRTGTPSPPVLDQAVPAIIYGDSVEVRRAEVIPVVHKIPFAWPAFVFTVWHAGRYRREGELVVLDLATEPVTVHWVRDESGTELDLPFGNYELKLDGVVVATASVSTAIKRLTFQVPPGSQGYKWGVAYGPGLTSYPFPFYCNPNGIVPPHDIPVLPISHDVVHSDEPFVWAMCPGRFTPTPRPLPEREFPPVDTAVASSSLYLTNIVPQRGGGILRPNITPDGVMSAQNVMGYHYGNLTRHYPQLSLLDGPRGTCTATFLTHIMPDRHGAPYCTTPWSSVRYNLKGEARTRCGAVMDAPAGQYQVPASLVSAYNKAWTNKLWETAADRLQEIYHRLRIRMVGDFSSLDRRYWGFKEIWSSAFLPSTLALDPNAPPIGGEQPHLNPPEQLLVGSQNGACYRLTFVDKDNLDAPPKVTLFHADLAHPFEVVVYRDTVFISERDANRIGRYRADGTLIDYPIFRSMPEGLFIAGDWLYFTSRNGSVNGKVERKHLVTGTEEFVCTIGLGNISEFIKIAVSWGVNRFGPEGTVFSTTWSNGHLGFPVAKLPGDIRWNYIDTAVHKLAGGRGGKWVGRSYSSAPGIGPGRLFLATAEEGLGMISLALPTDPIIDRAKYAAGLAQYLADGDRIIHGDNTHGFYGFPLPWGESPEKDYYMENASL